MVSTSRLDPRLERLVRLTVALVLGNWEELGELRRAAPEGEPDRSWREAVLQTHLFAGFTRLVEGCEVLHAAGGLGTPGEDELEAAGPVDSDGLAEAGRPLFDTIYGDGAASVRERLGAHHPLLARWVAEHAYGRVLARVGLTARERELLAVGALVATAQDRQLASHARGAVRCGATANEVLAVAELVRPSIAKEAHDRARGVLERFARS